MRPPLSLQAFPDAVAEDEAGIEDGNLGVRSADEFAVDADEDVVVTRVADVILGAGGGGGGLRRQAALRLDRRDKQICRIWPSRL